VTSSLLRSVSRSRAGRSRTQIRAPMSTLIPSSRASRGKNSASTGTGYINNSNWRPKLYSSVIGGGIGRLLVSVSIRWRPATPSHGWLVGWIASRKRVTRCEKKKKRQTHHPPMSSPPPPRLRSTEDPRMADMSLERIYANSHEPCHPRRAMIPSTCRAAPASSARASADRDIPRDRDVTRPKRPTPSMIHRRNSDLDFDFFFLSIFLDFDFGGIWGFAGE
jgi:hypothetical protein